MRKVVLVRVAPEIDFPVHVEQVALDQQTVLGHVRHQAVRHVVVRDDAIDVDRQLRIAELQVIVDGARLDWPRVAAQRIGKRLDAPPREILEPADVARLRDDREAFGDRRAQPTRVIEVMVRDDGFGDGLARHRAARFGDQRRRPRAVRRHLEQSQVILELEQYRIGAAVARQQPNARRDCGRIDGIGLHGLRCGAHRCRRRKIADVAVEHVAVDMQAQLHVVLEIRHVLKLIGTHTPSTGS